jgi:hypothetical protein
MGAIAEALARVRARIDAAARAAGRSPDQVLLVAVSKGQPASAIASAHAAGQITFGENYAQELAAKAEELSSLGITWHFIGHLQRNKVKAVVRHARVIETVDRVELGREIAKHATEPVDVLVEVNVGRESQKAGCAPPDLVPLVRALKGVEGLRLRGLMTVPPLGADAESSRRYFSALRELAATARQAGDDPGPHLSMGMSQDFEVAIAEGATMVRVGTAIFGPRPPKPGTGG